MQSTFIDMIGTQHGCWLVISRADNTKDGKSVWKVKCVECGKTRAFGGKHLRIKKPPCHSCRLINERKAPPPNKMCPGCSKNKGIEEFGKSVSCRYGVRSRCRECRSAESSRHYRDNWEDRKRANDRWRAKNKNYYEEQSRNRHLLNTYGITSETYKKLHDAQDGLCAICKQPETKRSKNGKLLALAVDHCHDTGKVRGLLCCTCNSGIGLIGDTKDRAKATVAYLEKAYSTEVIGHYEPR